MAGQSCGHGGRTRGPVAIGHPDAFGLLVRPMLRFLHMYFLRLGFLDGLPGIQICALMAFYNTFVKQGRLWEMEHALKQPDPEAEQICSLSQWRGEAGDTPQEDGSRKLRRA